MKIHKLFILIFTIFFSTYSWGAQAAASAAAMPDPAAAASASAGASAGADTVTTIQRLVQNIWKNQERALEIGIHCTTARPPSPRRFAFRGIRRLERVRVVRAQTLDVDNPDHNPDLMPSEALAEDVHAYITGVREWLAEGNEPYNPGLIEAGCAMAAGKTALTAQDAKAAIRMIQTGLHRPTTVVEDDLGHFPHLPTLNEARIFFPERLGILPPRATHSSPAEKLAWEILVSTVGYSLRRSDILAEEILGTYTLCILTLAGHGTISSSFKIEDVHGLPFDPAGQTHHDKYHWYESLGTNAMRWIQVALANRIRETGTHTMAEHHAALIHILQNYVAYQEVMITLLRHTTDFWKAGNTDKFTFWAANLFDLTHENTCRILLEAPLEQMLFQLFRDPVNTSALTNCRGAPSALPLAVELSEYKVTHPEFGEGDRGTLAASMEWVKILLARHLGVDSRHIELSRVMDLSGAEWQIFYTRKDKNPTELQSLRIYSPKTTERRKKFGELHRDLFGPLFRGEIEELAHCTSWRLRRSWASHAFVLFVAPPFIERIADLSSVDIGEEEEEEEEEHDDRESLGLYAPIAPPQTLPGKLREAIFALSRVPEGFDAVFLSPGDKESVRLLRSQIEIANIRLSSVNDNDYEFPEVHRRECKELIEAVQTMLRLGHDYPSPFPPRGEAGASTSGRAAAASASAALA